MLLFDLGTKTNNQTTFKRYLNKTYYISNRRHRSTERLDQRAMVLEQQAHIVLELLAVDMNCPDEKFAELY